MIYIVHGENAAQSRVLITNQQNKLAIETRKEFDVAEVTPHQVYESAVTPDLFGKFPFIVLDITTANKQTAEQFLEVFKKISANTNLVIYAQKTLPKNHVILANSTTLGAKIITSIKSVDSNIFKFVDNLFYKNRKSTYQELQRLLNEDVDPFYILSMILYGLRAVSSYTLEAPSSKTMKPFIKGKVEKQAREFTREKLTTLFEDMYTIDKKTKTGELSPDIAVTIAIEKILSA